MLENYTETKINIHYSLLVYQILSSMTFCCIRKLSSEIIDIHSCSTICFPELVSGYFLSFSLISCLDIQYKQQLFHNLTRSFVLLRNYDYSFHHSWHNDWWILALVKYINKYYSYSSWRWCCLLNGLDMCNQIYLYFHCFKCVNIYIPVDLHQPWFKEK